MARAKFQQTIKRWTQIPTSYAEVQVEANLMTVMWEELEVGFHKSVLHPAIGSGLIADWLLYQDLDRPPILVVEDKKRIPELADVPDADFVEKCEKHCLYKEAVGDFSGSPGNNGIRQYLDSSKVKPDRLASYGLVFNGDFFQLWRRVDGLVLPMTPIQRMTAETIPTLMGQLQYILTSPKRALITSIWNRKGGVSKTTNTVNLGATLAVQGKRVLLIDADEQNDLTRGVGLVPDALEGWFEESVDMLQKNDFDAAKSLVSKALHRRMFPLSSVPASNYSFHVLSIPELSIKEFRRTNDISNPDKIKVFKRLVNLVAGGFDYIFIDTSPAYEVFTSCILYAADTVLIPVDYGKKSLYHGVDIYKFLRDVRAKRAEHDKLYLGPWNLGLLFSNCPPDAGAVLNGLMSDELAGHKFTGRQCQTRIQTYAQTKVAEFKCAPVVCWQASPVTQLYRNLANELFLKYNSINE
ncbi:MAG: AAA family ATPase [Pegethrix bostrychoides GSE-TBD4-15B]|jgi:cellulose biosynthesis protein BcsQ|uniref:AAA family ATPase n=1 Tax=Pegethrix bostrychoides GSE-TBD4-15B TaxID=2839662 RepID=A0A951PB87_9CYAN|nr:AAA family ATPase [Pegethrix bostrychoides GSE-TBD4-15B]